MDSKHFFIIGCTHNICFDAVTQVRWSACSEKTLEHHKGLLGFDDVHEGHYATNIVETLESVITRFCTIGCGGPGPGVLDDNLKAHIIEHTEVLCADAASNEFAAGRLARKGAFQNVLHVSKDNAHASVRHGRSNFIANLTYIPSQIFLS